MKSNIANIMKRLVVPFGARDDQPRIIVGPDVPAELAAHYGDANITGTVVYWIDATRYAYSAVIANPAGPYRVDGVVNMNRPAGDRLHEVFSYFLNDAGDGRIYIGGFDPDPANPSNPAAEFQRRAVFNESVSMWKDLSVDRDALVNGALSVFGDLSIDGRSAPRGLAARFAATGSPVSTATTVETLIATVPSTVFAAGRAFEVTVRAQVTPTATLDVLPFIRKGVGTVGSPLVDYGRVQVPLGSGGDRLFTFSAGFRTGPAAVTTALTFYATTSAGTLPFKGFPSGPLVVEVVDVGAAADFSALPTLT